MDREKLLALADEIEAGPSGDRQRNIAVELRVIAGPAPEAAPKVEAEPPVRKRATAARNRRN